MTLVHSRRRIGAPKRTCIRENTTTSNERATDSDVGEEDAGDIYVRGCSQLPPTIPNEADRPLIRPEGKTHWREIPRLGKERKPASVLTCLLKTHHPGMVQFRGKSVVATTWKHYKAEKDTNGRSKADEVEEGFWLRFRYEPEYENAARLHVGECCKQVLTGLKYYARIQAIVDHYRIVKGVKMCDKMAGQKYLTRAEYHAQRPIWCYEATWNAMIDEWCNPDWIRKSETNRANRYTTRFKPHKGGSNSIATICQKLSEKEGREVSSIEAWVHTHRGPNLQDSNSLNTEEATTCLERYKRKSVDLNGEGFDWLHSPVDARALYDCSYGRPHGKWATFNGIIDDREALIELKSSNASSLASKRQRREEEERERRRETHNARLAKDYAQTLLDWSTSVHNHNTNIQMFMENVAKHTGMPSNAVPPPPPPPPPPPTYEVSTSPNLSLENVAEHTGIPSTAVPPPPPRPPTYEVSTSPNLSLESHTSGSVVGVENPDDTLNRIARGMFGGYVNTSVSADGNYSSPLDDDLALF